MKDIPEDELELLVVRVCPLERVDPGPPSRSAENGLRSTRGCTIIGRGDELT